MSEPAKELNVDEKLYLKFIQLMQERHDKMQWFYEDVNGSNRIKFTGLIYFIEQFSDIESNNVTIEKVGSFTDQFDVTFRGEKIIKSDGNPILQVEIEKLIRAIRNIARPVKVFKTNYDIQAAMNILKLK